MQLKRLLEKELEGNSDDVNTPLFTLLAQTTTQVSHHTHPIPLPEELEKYLKLKPDFAEEFYTQWRSNAEVKRDLDKDASKREDHKVNNEFTLENNRLDIEEQRVNNGGKESDNNHHQRILIIWLFAFFLLALIALGFVSLFLGQKEIGIGSLLAGGLLVIGGVLRDIFGKKKI